MNKLTNEQRVKVAEYCTSLEASINDVNYIDLHKSSEWENTWRPDSYLPHKDVLITKTAQLARVTGNPSIFLRLLDAIATNNIADIEALCYELLGEGL